MEYDVIVIGAGPGGYVCAIRLSQLGLKVGIVEKEKRLGGTCLRIGCIPSKALLESSEKYYELKELKEHGIQIKEHSFHLEVAMRRKEKVVEEITRGVLFLMQKNKIDVYHGEASFLSPYEIQVGKKHLKAKNFVIATGSTPAELPHIPLDRKRIISSDEALSLKEVPKKMAIVGAGVIGLELGSVWRRWGSKIYFIEIMDQILPGVDKQIARALQKILEKQGLKFYLQHKILSAKSYNNGVKITYETPKGEKQEDEVDYLFLAVGRKPYTKGLNLEKIGINIDSKGFIPVNSRYQTSLEHIYAIGDVIPKGPMLAHKASEEGIIVAERIAGKNPPPLDYEKIPAVVYTSPEVAWVGKSEEKLKEEKIPYKVGRFFFKANGRAKAMGRTDGFIKVLAEKNSNKILGVWMLGPYVSEMISEATLGMEFHAFSEDIALISHPHPSLSEVLKEASLDVKKESIHQ